MRPYAAVIFDMDGVIVDSEPLHEKAFQQVFEEMGYGTTHGFHFPDYYGRSDKALWLDFIARHAPPQPFDKLMAWKQGRFLTLLEAAEPIFPPIPSLVSDLARQARLALASGSNHAVIDAVLRMHGLRTHFETVVSAQDVARGKPAPDIFLHTAQRLGVDPADCVVIEDSAAGVAAARAAGMRVIGITNTLPAGKLQDATAVVADYDAIRRLLLDGAA